MCGIAGIIGEGGEALPRMLAALAHRGPDDEGIWREGDVAIGQRRLSIIDTSGAGHQPMQSACGRWVLTTNGEIYNHLELRRELDAQSAVPWRGHSDSETLLEFIARHGVEAALARASGMFAFGLWDRASRTAFLGRDRLGEKPLSYVADAKRLAFASEITALERLDGVSSDLSPAALGAFFRYGYVPAPLAILKDVRKLEPGCLLVWRQGEGPTLRPWWRLAEVAAAGRADRFADAGEAIEAADEILGRAVARQMIADVPIGVFLSGGLDSSLVTALMQRASTQAVRSFTLGFDVPAFNEAAQAAAVARHIGTEHTEHVVTVADAQGVAPQLGRLYDEPFADSSQIPAVLISRMASPAVKVCLTGDGADELFGGYVRYPGVRRLWRLSGRLPARRALGWALEKAPLSLVEATMAWAGPIAHGYAARGALGPGIRRAGRWLQADGRAAMFEATMTFWPGEGPLAEPSPVDPAAWRPAAPAFDNVLDPMLWRDAVDYLPGDILAKVDRAAMSVGLETRAPFLDPEVATLAWRLPPEMKLRGEVTKWLMRRVLARHVPPELTERPKVGFTVPLHAWLTGGLKPWADNLLDPVLIRRQGLLDAGKVEAAWRTLQAGDSGLGQPIWAVLMLQAWLAAR
jgi:asparagine synthase (glutamine-hydrolysing)